MLATELIIREFAESLIDQLKQSIPSSSGDTAQSFFYRYDGKRLQIGSTKGWITVLEDGRKPGKRAPKEVIEGQLTEWVKREIPSAKNPKSLAYAIATSQAENGSLLYQRGGKSGVLSDYLNLEYVNNNLTQPLIDGIITEIKAVLSR